MFRALVDCVWAARQRGRTYLPYFVWVSWCALCVGGVSWCVFNLKANKQRRKNHEQELHMPLATGWRDFLTSLEVASLRIR